MKILKSDLQSAVKKKIITSDQANNLWEYFESLRPNQTKFSALHVLYYFGGILILASMSWFLTDAWSNGWKIMAISSAFALIYSYVGHNLWTKQNLAIPAGLLITAAVGLAPVFIFGFQKATGLWPQEAQYSYQNYHIYIKGSWIFMEIGTIIAALVALRFYKFPFITFPLALALWYMSMDLTPLLFGKNDFTFKEKKIVSCVFGLFMLIASYFIDRKSKEIDFAFWTYLYGVLAFWLGLTMMNSNSEIGKFFYFLLNIGFVIFSVYLRRKVFMVFGAMGVIFYIARLAFEVFEDSYLFPVALIIFGFLLIALGIKYQKNKKKFESFIESLIPNFLNKWRPEERP